MLQNDLVSEEVDTDDACDLVIAIADGSLRDVPTIATNLRALSPQ